MIPQSRLLLHHLLSGLSLSFFPSLRSSSRQIDPTSQIKCHTQELILVSPTTVTGMGGGPPTCYWCFGRARFASGGGGGWWTEPGGSDHPGISFLGGGWSPTPVTAEAPYPPNPTPSHKGGELIKLKQGMSWQAVCMIAEIPHFLRKSLDI